MTAITHALRTALLDFVWQGLAVALLLWVALYLLRRRTPQARYAASCAALALLVALPVATGWLAYRAPSSAAGIAVAAALPAPGAGAAAVSASRAVDWAVRFEPWALRLWSAGVLLFSLRLVWGCWRVTAMRRGGRPADAEIMATIAGLAERMGLSRPVRVLTAALPDGPSIAGWLRPVLLLPPAAVLGLSAEQLEAVLAHELAHIRRYDHLVNAAQMLVETLLFYHPAVWWTSARIREERELCCDDMAVRACGDALCFARALAKLERLRVVAPAAVLGSTGGSLMHRVQRLIGAGRRDYAPSKLSGLLALSLGLVSLALNVHWAKGQERPAQVRGSVSVGYAMTGRDGAGVKVDLGGAALLHQSPVIYPEAARNASIEGTVAVEVTLDGDGNVSDAHVVSGPMELRRAVMSSVFDWHFTRESAGSTRVVYVTFDKAALEAGYTIAENQVRAELAAAAEHSRDRAVAQGAEPAIAADGASEDEQLARLSLQLNGQLDAERSRGLARASGDEAPTVYNLDRGRLTGQLEEERARLAAESATDRARSRDRIHTLEVELLAAQNGNVQAVVPGSNERRTIESIEVTGLSDAARSDLLSQLPVRLGDTVTPASLEGVGAAIRKFDEHLEWRLLLVENRGVSILIHAPNHEE